MLNLPLMALSILVPLFLGIPIAVALGLSGLAWLVVLNPVHLKGAAHAIWNTADSHILLAIPLFLLMGELVQRAAIAQRFYRSISMWVRWLPGGLLHANVGACAVFSAVSGSSVATAATVGTASIPDLLKLNYERRMIFGTLAAGGTLGILIPPSIPLILYAALADLSVGRLFLAAVVPGLLMFVIFTVYIGGRSILDRRIAPKLEDDVDWRARLGSLVDILPVVIILAVILGGIYLGWASPTEAAALGVLISLIVAFAYGGLSWPVFRDSVSGAVKFTAMIVFVIAGAQIFAYALFAWGITRDTAEWVTSLPMPPLAILSMIVLMYLILGMFIDAISMMVLTISVVFPIITGLGYDPIWFGVVLVLLLEIGLITPPVGINIYTIQGLMPGRITSAEVAMGSLPFVFLLLAGVVILVLAPELALWLPGQMFR